MPARASFVAASHFVVVCLDAMEPPSELRGEDTEQIYALMVDAQSNDNAVREPADKFLRSCERVPGFCSVLLAIVGQRDAGTSERVLSLICLRNVVRRHWSPSRRSAAVDLVADEGKRARCLAAGRRGVGG